MVKNPVGRYFAFEYDKVHDYYKTNETYGVQRYGGFTDLYDALGGFLGMDLDTKIVYYKANGVNYRLQFWKGSYGFAMHMVEKLVCIQIRMVVHGIKR